MFSFNKFGIKNESPTGLPVLLLLEPPAATAPPVIELDGNNTALDTEFNDCNGSNGNDASPPIVVVVVGGGGGAVVVVVLPDGVNAISLDCCCKLVVVLVVGAVNCGNDDVETWVADNGFILLSPFPHNIRW